MLCNHLVQFVFGAGGVFQILAANFRFEEQRVIDLRALGILLAQELVLPDRGQQRAFVREHAAFLSEQIGHCCYGCWSFSSVGTLVVDIAKGVQHFFVAFAGALRWWSSLKLVA